MRTISLIILSISLLLIFTKPISAQEKPGITVIPSIIRLDLSQDKTEAEIYYKNNTKIPVELTFFAQDFSQEEETGRVRFLLEQDAKNYQYSLTSWITFERQSLTLAPNEGQSLKIFINKEKLTPGGHYASIQAQLAQSEEEGQVPIKAILSTIIFVRSATGNEREEMSLQSVSPIRTLLGFPDTFLVRLQNKGNVELVPFGLIEIKDMLGNTVAKGVINEGSLITLPESVRRFDIAITRLTPIIFPGIFTADINIHFGKDDKNIKSSLSFVSQGSINLLLVGLIILAAVLTALFVRKSFQARSHQRQ